MIVRAIGGQVVTLQIGEPAKPFIVHKDLLVDSSPYFRNAFTGRFKEKDGEMVLNDVAERTSGILKKWLYAQKLTKPEALRDKYKVRVGLNKKSCKKTGKPLWEYIALDQFDSDKMGLGRNPKVKRQVYRRGRFAALDYTIKDFWHWDDLLDVFIMADKYDFPHMRDDVVRQWQWQAANHMSHCSIETVARAYDNLPEKSSLLALIVDHYAFLWKPSTRDIKAFETIAPKAFLASLSVAQAFHKGRKYEQMTPLFKIDPCGMHEHIGEDTPCVGFKDYDYRKTVRISRVWTNTTLPDESRESESEDQDDDEEEV
jgi:hypothetical protein